MLRMLNKYRNDLGVWALPTNLRRPRIAPSSI